MLDNRIGFGTDVWALGCTLFEIRAGRKLFSPFILHDDNEAITVVKAELKETPDPIGTLHPSVAQDSRSVKDKLAPGLWYME